MHKAQVNDLFTSFKFILQSTVYNSLTSSLCQNMSLSKVQFVQSCGVRMALPFLHYPAAAHMSAS